MPSQISLRAPPMLANSGIVGHKAVFSRNSTENGENDMKARAVGSLIITHNSLLKPHSKVSVNLNGSCGKTDHLDLTSKAPFMSNGTTTPLPVNRNLEVNHYARDMVGSVNGVMAQTPLCNPASPKTEGEHTNEESSLTNESNRGRLMCPDLAISYTGTLVGKRTKSLANKQHCLETKVAALQRKVRLRQLQVIHSHVSTQLLFDGSGDETGKEGEDESFTTSSEHEMEVSLAIHPPHKPILPLPIQVDGASDDPYLPYQQEVMKEESKLLPETKEPECAENEESLSSLDCDVSNDSSEAAEEGCGQAFTAQMTSLQTLLDEDWTDDSSDEEEGEESAEPYSRHALASFWEHSRSAIGSRWVWLQRRIAELNKQIYQLDHHVKGTHSQEKCEFSSGPSVTSVPAVTSVNSLLPHYFSLTSGPVFEHWRTTNGGAGLISVGKHTNHSLSSNGFSNHHRHTPGLGLPHLLLPEALLGAKLQVKDLLSPSRAERNSVYMDSGAARTRALVRRVNRKVVRKKPGNRGRNVPQHIDPAFHQHLSMAHELPSRIPLASGLRQVLSEHCYAQLPPLTKRHKASSSLSNLSTASSHDYEHYQSRSPSPVDTPLSLDSSRDGSYRKKNAPFLQGQLSMESASSSPWSPGISRPVTPNFTPLQSARKKRVTSSTPLFDIDNIVIPYSVAASTRLERLEYKEILTPSWREVTPPPPTNEGGTESQEDCSDQVYANRHNRCEMSEKKRFLNFISGSQRKRNRPQSMTLSDSPSLNSPPPLPPRRQTIASPSPTYAEQELVSHVHRVVLPWKPRTFPLNEANQAALITPPPPPPVLTRLSSPTSLRLTSTPSQTPSCTSSALATPIGTPPSTPGHALSPAHSEDLPAEWVLNSQSPLTTPPSKYNHTSLETAESALMTSHNPIILKLTKKV